MSIVDDMVSPMAASLPGMTISFECLTRNQVSDEDIVSHSSQFWIHIFIAGEENCHAQGRFQVVGSSIEMTCTSSDHILILLEV